MNTLRKEVSPHAAFVSQGASTKLVRTKDSAKVRAPSHAQLRKLKEDTSKGKSENSRKMLDEMLAAG